MSIKIVDQLHFPEPRVVVISNRFAGAHTYVTLEPSEGDKGTFQERLRDAVREVTAEEEKRAEARKAIRPIAQDLRSGYTVR